MDNNDIKQDYVAMKKIADDIHQKAAEFLRLKEELYQEFNKRLGDKSLTIWCGNRALSCLKDLNNKESEFNNIHACIEKLSGSLDEQASAWERFENEA